MRANGLSKKLYFAALIGALACGVDATGPKVQALEPQISCRSYLAACSSLAVKRAGLAGQFVRAATEAQARVVRSRAAAELLRAINVQLFPPWYGTPWDFNGMSQVPGQGTIACGYFVTTVLRDAGLKIQRIRLAQQSAENIVRTLCSERSIKRFRDTPLRAFVDSVSAWGTGLYVVGLDCHVGFIICDSAGVRFVHSTYVGPSMVIDEAAESSVVLEWSRYRILGSVTGDKNLLDAWLRGRPVLLRQ